MNTTLTRFNLYCANKIKHLSKAEYRKAFTTTDWDHYSQSLITVLNEQYAFILQQYQQRKEQECSLVILFSWDHQSSDAGIIMDYDFVNEERIAFEDGAYDAKPVISFTPFIKEVLGETKGDLGNVTVDDYRVMVELFSNMLIETVLQNTTSAEFLALTNDVELSIAVNYFHGEDAICFYQREAPVQSMFDETGSKQPLYLSDSDALTFAFEQDDISLISSLLPPALAGQELFTASELCYEYILNRAKDSSLTTENVWPMLTLMVPYTKRVQATQHYNAIVCNAIIIHKYNAEFIAFLDENFFPEHNEEPTITFNFACAYAVLGNKEMMLACMELGLELAKPKASFEQDTDFDAFRKDPDFIEILNNTAIDTDVLQKDLTILVKRGDFDEVEKLIELGADINYQDSFGTSVVKACIGSFSNDNHIFLSYLIDKGVDLEFKNLEYACWRGKVKIATQLLEKMPLSSLSHDEHWQLIKAISTDSSIEMLNLLVEHGFDVTITEENSHDTILHLRDSHKNIAFMSRLVELGVNPCQLNKFQKTTIFGSLHLDSIKQLVAWGVDINQINCHGQHVMHDAVNNDDDERIQYLTDLGCDIKIIDNNGESLLHHCTSFDGNKNSLKKLIELKVNLDVQDKSGKTALHNTARFRLVHLMEMLIAAGANTMLRDNDNNLALDIADISQTKALLE